MGSVQVAERGFFDRDPKEKISIASINRHITKMLYGCSGFR